MLAFVLLGVLDIFIWRKNSKVKVNILYLYMQETKEAERPTIFICIYVHVNINECVIYAHKYGMCICVILKSISGQTRR